MHLAILSCILQYFHGFALSRALVTAVEPTHMTMQILI